MSDLNKEALDVWGGLKPMIDQEISSRTQGMVQRRKAKVTTAPSLATNTIGVTEAFGDEMFLPFVSNMISAKVGDFVWIEWMYGATNAFVSSYAAVDDKNVSVAGVLDVVPRRCFRGSDFVAGNGWKRAMDINWGSVNDSKFAGGAIVDICIGSTYFDTNNMLRKITLNGIYNNVTFDDEHSKSNNLNLIDKIRYTIDSSNHGHIDIHYNYSSRSYLWVTFDVHTFVDLQDEYVASDLTAVVDSPSGETVVTEYTFAANTSGTSTPTAGTYASVNIGSYVYRQGNIVYGQISMLTNSVLSSGGWRNLANISAGFRPNTNFDSFLVNNANDTPIHLRILTDGTVNIYPTTNIATGVLLLACFTYHCS